MLNGERPWAIGDRMGKVVKELLVWQKARELAIDVYKITTHGNFKRDYGLIDQIRRSSVSVPSNIAEGDERDTDKDLNGLEKRDSLKGEISNETAP